MAINFSVYPANILNYNYKSSNIHDGLNKLFGSLIGELLLALLLLRIESLSNFWCWRIGLFEWRSNLSISVKTLDISFESDLFLNFDDKVVLTSPKYLNAVLAEDWNSCNSLPASLPDWELMALGLFLDDKHWPILMKQNWYGNGGVAGGGQRSDANLKKTYYCIYTVL